MKLKMLWYSLASVAVMVAAATAIGDTITMKSGETLRGTVRQFRHNHHATASSAFVVDVDGEEQSIPLHKIETITFERPAQPTAQAGVAGAIAPRKSQPRQPVAMPSETTESESDSGAYWLTTSSRKRHNEKCRYYKTSKGRSCGPNEGVPCGVCGG
jgi:hypothetical protein